MPSHGERPFSDPDAVARYREGPPRQVPGFADLHRMVDLLRLAAATTEPFADRIHLHEGYVDSAPEGPFDAATCLLTLHFIPAAERLTTLQQLHRRLTPGGPLVVAHHSFPPQPPERDVWLGRYAAYAVGTGAAAAAQTAKMISAMGERLPVLSPEDDEALLREAGFRDVSLFYAALTFRGWVAHA
jgi:tRNA (cmo5U34)-methyltransferase